MRRAAGDRRRANPAGGEGAGGGGVRDAAVAFATRVGVGAAGLASQLLLAWALLPEGRGAYAVCVTFAALLALATSLSADRGAQYFVMTGRIDMSRGAAIAFGAGLAGAAAGAAAALPLIAGGQGFFGRAEPGAFRLALVLVPLVSLSMAAEQLLAGIGRFAALAVHLAVRSVVALAAVAVLVGPLGLGVEGGLLALAAGHGAMLLLCLRDLRKHGGLALAAPSFAELRRAAGYGLRYHPGRLGVEGERHLGVLALGLLAAPAADIGLFAVASALALSVAGIANAAGVAAYPRVAAAGGGEARELGLRLRLVVMATAAALAALLACAGPLVRVALSDAFAPVVPLMAIMAPGVLAYSASNMFATWFNGAGRPGVCSWTAWCGLGAAALALPALYSAFGAAGAAAAAAFGAVVRAALLAAAFHRATGAPAREIWAPRAGDFALLWARRGQLALFAARRPPAGAGR